MNTSINKEKLEKVILISKTILKDLHHFGGNAPKPHNKISYTERLDGSRDSVADSSIQVAKEDIKLLKTAFIAYLKLLVNGKEEIWYFTRQPLIMDSRKENIKYKRTQVYSGLFAEKVGEERIYNPDKFKKSGYCLSEFKYKIIEKNIFRSINKDSFWDAINNSIDIGGDQISPESLKEVLKTYYPNRNIEDIIYKEDVIEEIAAKLQTESSTVKAGIYSGYKRQSIEKAELKDIAIMNDIFQEKAFRQPLNRRVILTGIAGTGKTSVLIKRVAQHTDYGFIEQEDKQNIKESEIESLFNPYDSWIAFSPNQKVMDYLKEAFDNDNVYVSTRHLKTWISFRDDFINDIKLLNNDATQEGKFTFTDDEIISIKDNHNLIRFSQKFDKFVYNKIDNIIKKSKRNLSKCNKTKDVSNLLKLLSLSKNNGKFSDHKNYLDFYANINKANSLLKNIDYQLKTDINELVEQIIKKNNNVLYLVEKIINKDYNNFTKEDIQKLFSKYNPKANINKYSNINEKELKKFISKEIQHYCKLLFNSKELQKRIFTNHFISFALRGIPFKQKSKRFHNLLITLSSLSFLKREQSPIINNIPNLYAEFRKILLKKKSKLLSNTAKTNIVNNNLSNLEIDLIIFQILRNTKWIFNKKYSIFENGSSNKLMNDIKSKYRTQVLIDEIADFSTLQIGSMFSISHPKFNSVFLTGDLMQKTEQFGLSSWDELEYLSFDFNKFELQKVYRHTQKLLNLIRELYTVKYNQQPEFESVYPSDEREPNPIKYKYISSKDHFSWVSQRIIDIFNKNKNVLPSIAIFVPSEDLIEYTRDNLVNCINENNEFISFKSCFEGDLGEGDGVRILSIKYIKGLEFEGVFIMDIDKISSHSQQLIDNLLYVAITRAAAYLGISYSKEFPKKIKFIENYFTSDKWEN